MYYKYILGNLCRNYGKTTSKLNTLEEVSKATIDMGYSGDSTTGENGTIW